MFESEIDYSDYNKAAYYFTGRHLFRMVIRRAQEEAEGKNLLLTSRRQTKERVQKAAIRWLTRDSNGLRRAWYLSHFEVGVTYQNFRRRMQEKYGHKSGS